MKISGIFKILAWLVLVYLYAGLVGGRLPYFILYASVGILAISLVWTRMLAAVKVTAFLHTNRSEVGKTVVMSVVVENGAFFPLPWVYCNMTMPGAFGEDKKELSFGVSLRPHDRLEVKIPLDCCVRGFFQWGKITVTSGDVFGFLTSSKTFENRLNLLVRPRVDFLGRSSLRAIDAHHGDRVYSAKVGRQVSEFRGVRAYTQGDSLSRIHWKASVKAQRFLVKEYDQSMLSEILVFVDLSSKKHCGEGYRNTVERGITVAASLAATAIQEGLNVGMTICTDDILALPAARSKGHLCLILDFLARALPGSADVFPDIILKEALRHPRGTKMILVTPDLNNGLVDTLTGLTTQGYKPFVVSMLTEDFGDTSIDSAARKETITHLSHFGVQVLLVDKLTNLHVLFGGVQHEAV